MPDDPTSDSPLRPDAPGDLETLELMMASDEASEASERIARPRDSDSGRWVAGAKDGTRAGQRLTPEEIKAEPKAPTTKTPGDGDAGTLDAIQTKDSPQAGASKEAVPADKTETPTETAKTGSPYQREMARRDLSWKTLNAEKEALKAEKETWQRERELADQTIAARERALSRVPKYRGFTAEQLEQGATDFAAKARAAEAAGDFDTADQQRELATAAQQQAAQLRAQGGAAQSPRSAWDGVKAAMPEVLQAGNAFNTELRALIQSDAKLLEHADGPWRAVVAVGKKVVGKLEADLQRAGGEAAKVPALTEKVATLTARIRELEGQLSLPGGGGALNRGGGNRQWGELSAAEMEAQLDREMARG